MLKLAETHIMSLEPYIPGRSMESYTNVKTWAKLGSNENCLGPSKLAVAAMRESLHQSHLYPNSHRADVIDKLINHYREYSIQKNQIALGNGTSELIVNLIRSLLAPNEAMLHCWPTFVMYPIAATAHGREPVAVPVKEDMSFDIDAIVEKINDRQVSRRVKLVFLANPNNPTGKFLNHDELKYVVDNTPKDVVLVIDEAYFEYVTAREYPNGLRYALTRPRTIVLRTFSKIYGLAGLRLGYAIGDAHVIDLLCRIRDPFNVNSMVQNAAMAALDDHEHVLRSIRHNLEMKPKVAEELRRLGFRVCDGVGNFVMAKRNNFMPSIKDLCEKLYLHGVIIRPLQSFGLSDWVRVTIGLSSENAQLFEGLEKVVSSREKSIAAT